MALSKLTGSHVQMWELDNKEGRVLKSWCFRTVVLKKTLTRVPLTARRSNLKEILKEINPDYSLERLMLKLKFQYFGHLMQTADSLEKTLMLGKIESRRRRGKKRMRWHHWFNGQELEQTPGNGEGQRSLACCSPWGREGLDTTWRLNKLTWTLTTLSLLLSSVK